MPEMQEDREIAEALQVTLRAVQAFKPNDRSPKDRRYAVTVTMLEQAVAYFRTYVYPGEAVQTFEDPD